VNKEKMKIAETYYLTRPEKLPPVPPGTIIPENRSIASQIPFFRKKQTVTKTELPPGVMTMMQASGPIGQSAIQKNSPMKYASVPLGTTRSGWGKPVPLLGLTTTQQKQIKSRVQSRGVTKNVVKDMTAFRNRTVPSASIPGRFFSDQAMWIAAAEAQRELQKYRLNPEDPNWEIADQVGSIVSTGLNYINPVLGALGGPLIEGISQLASHAAKNNVFEGSMGFGSNENIADFKRYADYVAQMEKEGYFGLKFDDWKKWDTAMKAYNNEGGSCQKITQDMLGGLTLEEYMKQNGVDPAGPPPEAPKGEKQRELTAQEQQDLKDIRLQ
jgi:hypothetical protein